MASETRRTHGGNVSMEMLMFQIVTLLSILSSAEAASFTSDRATAQTAGAACKRAQVSVDETRVLVDCPKAGYARKLSELHELTWSVKGGRGTMLAEEADGSDFVIIVRRKEFRLLKAVLLENLEDPGSGGKTASQG